MYHGTDAGLVPTVESMSRFRRQMADALNAALAGRCPAIDSQPLTVAVNRRDA